MIKTLKLFCTFIVLFNYKALVSFAWWDNGHMLIASIAESQMLKSDIDIINAYLGVFEDIYPKMSNMITASIFPDHTLCRHRTPACLAFPFIDHMTTFNGYHFNYIPYNPLKLDEEMLPKPRKGSKDSMFYLLNQVKAQVENMEAQPCTKQSCQKQIGSDFSWNFNLRFFIHLYGDIHVPAHCGYGVNNYFPLGDRCGLDLKMSWPVPTEYTYGLDRDNFHSYMDGAGNKFYKQWPDVNVEQSKADAQIWMKKYPKYNFSEEFLKIDSFDIEGILLESNKILVEFYEIIDFKNHNPNLNKLILTEETHNYFSKVLDERIVLAGYRLAEALTRYARALPELGAKFHSSLSQ